MIDYLMGAAGALRMVAQYLDIHPIEPRR